MHTKSRKTNIKLLILTFIVFAAFYIISATSSKTAFATDPTDTDTANFTVTSTRTLTLSLSNTNVSLNLTPSATGEFSSTASNPLTITVSTNNDTGFNLNMTTTTTDLTRTTPLSGSFPVIETLSSSGSITATEFAESTSTTNKWGYSLDGINFNPVATSSSILSRTTADIDGSPTTTNLTFGVKLNNSIPQGDYKTTLNFIATAYPIDATFDNAFSIAGKHTITYNDKEYYRMQDMSPWICSMVASPADTTEETTETTQLIDIRDNNIYWVAKLLDGNCWMTQDLDFDITGETLTSETTNLVAFNDDINTVESNIAYTTANGYSKTDGVISWTPASTAITIKTGRDKTGTNGEINYGTNIDKWSSINAYIPYSVDSGKWYQTGTYFLSSVCNDVDWSVGCNFLDSTKHTTDDGTSLSTYFRQTPYTNNGTHGTIGNWYNWNIAVAANDTSAVNANNITMSNSICPTGWGLPINGEYDTINSKYNPGSNTGYERDLGLMSGPLHLVRGGAIATNNSTTVSTLYDAGRGGYWSSTTYNGSQSYYLYFSSSYTNPGYVNPRANGRSVRCLARTE